MPAVDAAPIRQKLNHPKHHMAIKTLLKNKPWSYMIGATGHLVLEHFEKSFNSMKRDSALSMTFLPSFLYANTGTMSILVGPGFI